MWLSRRANPKEPHGPENRCSFWHWYFEHRVQGQTVANSLRRAWGIWNA